MAKMATKKTKRDVVFITLDKEAKGLLDRYCARQPEHIKPNIARIGLTALKKFLIGLEGKP